MKVYALLLAFAAFLLAAPGANSLAGEDLPSAPKPTSPKYTPHLANFTAQWAISLQRRDSPDAAWRVHTCNATVIGADCNQPPLVGATPSQVKIVFARRNASAGALRTWKGGVPTSIKVRLDYGASVQVDRGWRKKNQAYPGHGWHAKWTVATMPYNETGGEAVWNLSTADEVTDAILYPEVCVICTFPDGSTDYCQCDRRNGATNYLSVETVVEKSITPAMRAAAIALSVFSPLFLIFYATADTMYFRKTGKSLRIGHI
ncbi:hypothetical protein HYH02_014070 [Chlamydomonas schloesseri]|uniref:Uncharacterized protein n=1 Tax=Chlamydomonas schloesseri TaxID=2026947 RepID=A0A835VVH0_9CHLO|nr:hypothetical protein HYH02_014070 [Chlamydomonas schloesseri]|eukprot:KAG2429415.1 hypothetical protein HYH02_014070 [Chlamydomonas schloesseri]